MKISFTFIITQLCLLLSGSNAFAQLPVCDKIYLDQYHLVPGAYVSSKKIYNYDPASPISSTNPALNTISLPDTSAIGLTVGIVLGSNNNTLTFYTTVADQYWYYNPATAAWVATGHQTGSQGTAFNLASGGGYIYNLDGSTGNVYKYDGTSDGTYLMTVPDFFSEGPYDLIADCAGNFYVLNVTGINAPPFMRKYSSTGALIQSWNINNPNHYFEGNGYGFTAGFGIIGTQIYVDNYDSVSQTETIVKGDIGTNTIDFVSASAAIPNYVNDFLMGDFGSCASSVPIAPSITISASATTVAPGTNVVFTSNINAGGNAPQYQWYLNGVIVNGQTNPTFTYSPGQGDVVTCLLTSNLSCVSTSTALSNAITITIQCISPSLKYTPSLICKGQAESVIPEYNPSGGTFQSTSGLSVDNNSGAINLNTSDTGTFVITYTLAQTSACPAASTQDTVHIITSPGVRIMVGSYGATLCQDENIILKTDSLEGFSYRWLPKSYFPGADSTSTVTAKIVDAGTIKVVVSNGGTCSASDSVTFNPIVCCSVMIPNAFSPNGDGLNDVFMVNANTTQTIKQFSVYNRFGQRIFYSNVQSMGWDGNYKNQPADQGVYYYYLEYKCANGQDFIKKGDVSLIR